MNRFIELIAAAALQLSGYTNRPLATMLAALAAVAVIALGLIVQFRLPTAPVAIISYGVFCILLGVIVWPSTPHSVSDLPAVVTKEPDWVYPKHDPFATPIPDSETGSFTPYSLMELYASGSTTAQSDLLVKYHIGSTMTFNGVVNDVSMKGDDENPVLSVNFTYQFQPYRSDAQPKSRSIISYFDKSWRHRLETLAKGEKIIVKGKVEQFNNIGNAAQIIFEDCEVVGGDTPK